MDTPDPTVDKVYGRINKLLHLTRAEDERGLVLSVAAFAEDLLGRLLLAYLRGGKSKTELIEGFNAPLGTFSARIKAAHAVGLLSDEQQNDLEIARKIRNEFAHNWEGCKFEQQNIKDMVALMKPSRIEKEKPLTTKEAFEASMRCVLVELSYVSSTIGDKGRVAPVVASHLSLEPYKGAR